MDKNNTEQNQPKNILIAVASTKKIPRPRVLEETGIETTSNFYEYLDEDGKSYCVDGVQTNETVPKLLIQLLAQNNQKLDKVLLLLTKEAKDDNITGLLQEELSKQENGEEVIVEGGDKILSSESSTTNEMFGIISALMEKIPNDANVYIDMTGGFRDSAAYLIAAMQYIKSENYNLKKVFYVNFITTNSDKNRCKIYDRTQAYNIFDVYSALNEFEANANVDKLVELYPDNQLLKAAKAFYDEIKIARYDKGTLKACIKEVREKLKVSSDEDVIFKRINDGIRDKYKILLENDGYSVYNVIKWCYQNQHYAQALFFLTEHLSEFIFMNHILYTTNDEILAECKNMELNQQDFESKTLHYYFITKKLFDFDDKKQDDNIKNDILTVCLALSKLVAQKERIGNISVKTLQNYNMRINDVCVNDVIDRLKINEKAYEILTGTHGYIETVKEYIKCLDSKARIPANLKKYGFNKERNQCFQCSSAREIFFKDVDGIEEKNVNKATAERDDIVRIVNSNKFKRNCSSIIKDKNELVELLCNFYWLRQTRNKVGHANSESGRSLPELKKRMGKFIEGMDAALKMRD